MHGLENKQTSFSRGRLYLRINSEQILFSIINFSRKYSPQRGSCLSRKIFSYANRNRWTYSKCLTVEWLRFTTTQATGFQSTPIPNKRRANWKTIGLRRCDSRMPFSMVIFISLSEAFFVDSLVWNIGKLLWFVNFNSKLKDSTNLYNVD